MRRHNGVFYARTFAHGREKWNPDFIVAAGNVAYEKGSDKVNVFKGDPISCDGDYIRSPSEGPDASKTRFFPALRQQA